jgi:6-phosphogluconate dehydrogenase
VVRRRRLRLAKGQSCTATGRLTGSVTPSPTTRAYPCRDTRLANLLVDPRFSQTIADRQDSWRRIVKLGIDNGIGLPAFSASLAYYDTFRRERLPGNLIQAQRDYFGAHTYERTAKPGEFIHTEWNG